MSTPQAKPDVTIIEEPDGTVVIRLESDAARFNMFELIACDTKDNTISFLQSVYSKPLTLAHG